MSFSILAQMIGLLANLLIILIFLWVIVSWILPPYHPLREALDRLVEPDAGTDPARGPLGGHDRLEPDDPDDPDRAGIPDPDQLLLSSG